MQHSIELLVATLVYTQPDRDADAQAYIRLIGEMMRKATGLVATQLYRSREQQHYYFLLNTWENEEYWHQAQERYNPKALLLAHPEFLIAQPEQWYTHYRWGYNRPAGQQTVATTHIVMVGVDELEATRGVWLQELRKQAAQFTFTFGFLAYGVGDTSLTYSTANVLVETAKTTHLQSNNAILTFIGWPSNAERVAFYSTNAYQQMITMVEENSETYALLLDPL